MHRKSPARLSSLAALAALLLAGCTTEEAPPAPAPSPDASTPVETPVERAPSQERPVQSTPAAADPAPPSPEDPGEPAAPTPQPPRFGPFRETLAFTACRAGCFEPVLAADFADRVFVTTSEGGLAVSEDGGRAFGPRDEPPLPPEVPPGVAESRGQASLQVSPDGRLYYSALLLDERRTPDGSASTARLLGAQVAYSTDGARSWASNVFVPLPPQPATLAPMQERPWLAFGPNDTVYLGYELVVLAAKSPKGVAALDGGVWIGRSDDGGATFGPFRRVFDGAFSGAVAGTAVVDTAGRLLLPAFDHGGAPAKSPVDPLGSAPSKTRALRVAISEDGGETFTKVEVTTLPGGFLPSLVAAPDGRLHLAWWAEGGRMLLSSSADGGRTWSPAERLSAPGENATASPWLLAHDGLLDAAWLTVTGEDRSALTLARRPLDGSAPFERLVVVPRIDGHPGNEGNTDSAQMARLLTGGVALAWSDRSLRETRVAIES